MRCGMKIKRWTEGRKRVKSPAKALIWCMALLPFCCGLAMAGESPEINFDKIVFLSSWTQLGKVQLVNGEYREPAAPGSATQTVVKLTDARVFGKLGGKDVGAVILVTDTGGSGTFYDLALLVKGPQGWVHQDSSLLGDRIKIHFLVMKDNAIMLDMTTHGPGDPRCCPTQRVIQWFSLKDNRLVKMSDLP
jgi:hypothetical protein